MVPGFVGHEGKRRRFLRFGRQSEFVGGANSQAHRTKLVGQHGEQSWIVGAAAGDHEFSKMSATWQHKAAQGIGDRTGGQGCGSGDYIRFACSSTTFDELLCELASELFASGGFGRLAKEKWETQSPRNNAVKYQACGRDASIAIVGLPEKPVDDCIDHHVARAGVESRNLLRGCSRRNYRQVGDAANVLHDVPNFGIAIEQVIEEGNQGRAFASRSHVGWTKIRDDRDADSGRENGAFSSLPGDGQLAAQEFGGLALVVESLAVTTDQRCFQAESALSG